MLIAYPYKGVLWKFPGYFDEEVEAFLLGDTRNAEYRFLVFITSGKADAQLLFYFYGTVVYV